MAGSVNSQRLYRLRQYTSSPGNRAYCFAELAISFLAMTVTIVSTYRDYP